MKVNLWIHTNVVEGVQLETMSYFQTEMIWPVQWAEKCRQCLKIVVHTGKLLSSDKRVFQWKDMLFRVCWRTHQYREKCGWIWTIFFFLRVRFKESQVWKEISLCLLIHILFQIYFFQLTNTFRKALYTTITLPGRKYRLKFNS